MQKGTWSMCPSKPGLRCSQGIGSGVQAALCILLLTQLCTVSIWYCQGCIVHSWLVHSLLMHVKRIGSHRPTAYLTAVLTMSVGPHAETCLSLDVSAKNPEYRNNTKPCTTHIIQLRLAAAAEATIRCGWSSSTCRCRDIACHSMSTCWSPII